MKVNVTITLGELGTTPISFVEGDELVISNENHPRLTVVVRSLEFDQEVKTLADELGNIHFAVGRPRLTINKEIKIKSLSEIIAVIPKL